MVKCCGVWVNDPYKKYKRAQKVPYPHAQVEKNGMNVGQMVNYVKHVTWQTVKYIATNYGQKDRLSSKRGKFVVGRVHK